MSARLTREPIAALMLVACLLVATLLTASTLRGNDVERADADRAVRQQQAAAALAEAVEEPVARLELIAASVRATAPSKEEFGRLARPALALETIRTMGLVQTVPERERAGWERRTGIAIVEGDPPRPADPRLHFVVAGQASRGAAPLGTDLGADPARVAAFGRAASTGRAVATPPVRLLGATPDAGAPVVVAFEPAGGGRFVSSVLSFDRLSASLQAALPEGTQVRVTDGDAAVVDAGSAPAGAAWQTRSVDFEGRAWTVRTAVGAPAGSPAAALALGLGLLLTGGVAYLLLTGRRRERLMQAEVSIRVAERDAERELLASVFTALPDGLGTSDDGRLLQVNDALCEISGYSREELLGALPSPMWPPESHAALAEATRRADRDGRAEVETLLRTKAGDEVPVLLAASTVRNPDGTIRMRIGVVKDIAARVAAERALAASEANLRELADAAAEVVLRLSPDERVQWASASSAAVLGMARETLVGRRLGELFADAALEPGAIQRDGGVRRMRRPDGAWIWTETSMRPLRDTDGSLVGIRAAVRDVTEREAARRKLLASESRYRALAATLPDTVVFMVDRDLRFVLVEGGALEAAGWRRDMVEGRTAFELLSRPERQPLLDRYVAAVAGTPSEYAHTSENGHSYLTRFVPQRDEHGAPDGAMVVSVDVTVVRRQEEASRRADARFRAMFEHASTGIGMVDDGGRIVETNATWARMLAIEPAELVGVPLADLAHPDDRDVVRRICALAQPGESETTVELRLRASDGLEVWTLVAACRLPDGDDDRARVLCQVQEFGARKSLEQELRTAADHDALTGLLNRRGFEARVRERVAEDTRHGGVSALLVGDLDGFKAVNDTLGHAAGDELLREAATALREALRTEDLLARIGGDEFAILVPHADAVDLDAVARRARDAVQSVSPPGLKVTASYGIALLHPGQSLEIALAAADAALYEAKAGGRAQHRHAPV